MTTYNNYVTIPHSTYAEWRSNTLGNSYDVDGQPPDQPYQCWDFAAEFWYNLGFGEGYPLTGGNNAKGIWENRNDNKGDVFDLIYNPLSLKVGDIICFSYGDYGHVGFLDDTYDGGSYFKLLSQNNSQPYVTSENYGSITFQGAFRYKAWNDSPTSINIRKSKFPWVLYARKLRNRY